MTLQKGIILLGIVLLSCTVHGAIQVLDSQQPGRIAVVPPVHPQPIPTGPVNPAPSLPVFDVTAFGGKADGKTDSFGAFIQTWNKACKESAVPSKVVIPAGNFLVGQVIFAGPCKSQITLEVLGHVLADTDPQDYPSNEWISFQDITGLVITGPGIFDGQGAHLWPSTKCDLANTVECAPAPTSLKFDKVNNVVVNGITSLNPKQFHFALSACNNFEASGIKLTAPRDSPNTVGFSVTTSQQVKISNTVIGTGGNCFNIAPGSAVSQANVNCVFGH